MIAVFGEEGQLGTGRRLHPPDDEPYRRGVCLGLEGGAGGLGHIGGTVHPVRNRRPGIFGYRLDEIVQAFVLADGDGVADIDPAADGDHGVGIEAAVGTHGELPAGPAVANPAHRFTQEVGGAASGVGPALAQPGHQHVAGAGGDGQQRVIALQMSTEGTVKRAAGDSSPTIGAGWPQGFVWLHSGQILAGGFQGLLYGPERWLRHLPFAMLPAFAPVAVKDGVSILDEVSGFEIENPGAPSARQGQRQDDGAVP